ncbi:MAG TPA: hypothetical protein VJ790_23525 [Dongiaceae bacterium]|nr:hypothetical protein [Dongiaceae bacterium]
MSLGEMGAMSFGLVIGWFLYLINRYRKGDVQFGDITTVVGAVGGAAVTRLFSEGGELFGAYGLGLAIGFFSYFIILLLMVAGSKNFNVDFFLDGRRRQLAKDEMIPADWRSTVLAADEPG